MVQRVIKLNSPHEPLYDVLHSQLEQGVQELNIKMTADIQKKLITYLVNLNKWNKAYNLTAISDINKMLVYHVFDSLSIQPYLKGTCIADVGSGAGLPGIPLAMINGDKKFTLIESSRKKIIFLQQMGYLLELKNIEFINQRVESYHPERCFDIVITRAFAPLKKMLRLTQHLLCPDGKFLAMKGQYPKEELEELSENLKITHIQLNVPKLAAERCLIIINNR